MPATRSSQFSEEEWRETILRYHLRVRAESIKRLASKLEYVGDFPAETPRKLSKLIKHSADVIGQNLSITPADQLKHVNFLLCAIAAHLRFIERSRVAHTPWSMIQATESFLKRQVGDSTHFIIRPQWYCNYSLHGDFVEIYRTEIHALRWFPNSMWDDLIGQLAQEKIYCISFPRIERLNCLLHANWGHELGHIIASKWIQSNFARLWQGEEAQIKNTIEQVIRENPPPVEPLFRETIIRRAVAEGADTAMEAAKQGLTEIICDAIGAHLFGPAALAAAVEFSAPLSIDESPLTCDMYPPWRYRIRLMVQSCEEDLAEHKDKSFKYPGPVIEPFWNWLGETIHLVQSTEDRQSLNSAITTREAYRVIEANWQRIHMEALQLLPAESAEPYHLFKRVLTIKDLVLRLEQDTPPNEVGKWPTTSPASLEDILNAAWVFKIKKMCQDPCWGSPDDYEKLFRLALKATEVSFVHNTFGPQLEGLE